MPTNKERTLNRTERLFAEVLLLQNRSDMSARDLAEHFGVSRRTIFRDLRALGEAEVPLTYSEGGGYKILDGYQLPPLMLSAREAATLLMGTEFVKLQPEQSLRKDADEVALKNRQVLPEQVREFIDALNDRTVLDPYWLHALEASSQEEGRWYNISRAVAEQHPLQMEYYVASRDEVTARTVDPLGLVYYTDHWNLVAYDHLREAIRNFRLDRIEEMSVMGLEWFEPPEDFDLQEHLDEREDSPANRRIRIRFDAREYQWARRGIPAQIEEERETDDGDVEVTFSFENLDYVAHWLLRYGTNAEVLEPDDLREKMRAEAMELAAQYPA
jgi:predicted DNA-binding transcriptional regulator YafY